MHIQDNDEPVIEPTPARRPGEELARARESAGIELRAMADTLHLPENQVRAIENDDYDRLPPPTFVRGYLRSYARVVGLDDDGIVAAYEALGAAADDPTLHLSGGKEATAHRRGLALALSVLVLAVAVSVGAWWWQSRATGSPDGPTAPVADAEQTAEEPAAEEPAAEEPAAEEQSPAEATARADAADGARPSADAGADEPAAAQGPASVAGERAGTDLTQSAESDAPALAELGEGSGTAGGGASEPRLEPTPGGPTASSDARTVGLDARTDESDSAAADEAGSAAESEESSAAQPDTGATADAAAEAASDSTTAEATATADAADAASYEPPAQTASASRASSPLAAEGPELLKLDFDGRSWIEIYDARGRELVYTLYTGSAPLELRGWPPFDVFLGNSPAVSVEFNGGAVEKSVFTRSDNTARFLVDTDGARRR